MTRMKIEIDVETGEVIVRPYTDEENAQADLDETVALSRSEVSVNVSSEG